MAKVRVVPATEEHVDFLKGRLRQSDIDECEASVGMGPDEALVYSFSVSQRAWTALVGDKPILMFGVAAWSLVSKVGAPWLLGTDDIEKHKVGVAIHSRPCVAEMAKGFELLENWVDTRNKISIKWLKWCGFKVDEAGPFGTSGLPFHRFWLKED